MLPSLPSCRPSCQRRGVDQPIESDEQPEVPLAVEGGDGMLASGLVRRTQLVVDEPGDQPTTSSEARRSTSPLRCSRRTWASWPAERSPEPTQLVAHRIGHRPVEQRRVGGQSRPEPPRSDPQAVDRLRPAGPYAASSASSLARCWVSWATRSCRRSRAPGPPRRQAERPPVAARRWCVPASTTPPRAWRRRRAGGSPPRRAAAPTRRRARLPTPASAAWTVALQPLSLHTVVTEDRDDGTVCPHNAYSRRLVDNDATGATGRSRTIARTCARSGPGTDSAFGPSGARSSARVSRPAGSLRCQPRPHHRYAVAR